MKQQNKPQQPANNPSNPHSREQWQQPQKNVPGERTNQPNQEKHRK